MSAVGADHFATATEIPVGTFASDPTPSSGLTVEPGEPYSGAGLTAWWKFTPSAAGTIRVDTWGSSPAGADTIVAIYTGASVDALTEVASNDDSSSSFYSSRVIFDAEAGTTYYVQVDAYGSDPIDYVLGVQAVTQTVIRATSSVAGPLFPNRASANGYEAPTVTGTGQQWSDDSDATYADLATSNDPAYTDYAYHIQQGYVTFDALPDAVDITAVTVRSMPTDATSSGNYRVSIGDVSTASESDVMSVNGSRNAAPTVTVSDGTKVHHVDVAVAALRAGRMYLSLQAETAANATNTIRILEASVTAIVPAAQPAPAAAPPSRGLMPPLRQYPRSDGLGVSGVKRVYPRPSSRQASNRRIGGYF